MDFNITIFQSDHFCMGAIRFQIVDKSLLSAVRYVTSEYMFVCKYVDCRCIGVG